MIELAVIVITLGATCLYAGVSYISLCILSLLFGVGFCIYFPYKRAIAVVLVLVLMCFTGALIVSLRVAVTPQELFGKREFTAKVVSLDRQLDSTTIIVRENRYDKQIQLTLYEHVSVLPGDTITISGIIERPEDFVTDTGRLFEYRNYLESKRIVGIVKNPTVEVLYTGEWSVLRSATIIRHKIAEVLSQSASFPYDGIAAAMVFGYQGTISKEIEELFRSTGVLHTLVLSGYNITLLGVLLGVLLKYVPQWLRIGIIFMALVLLILISGAGAASVRAGVMGSIGLLSILTLRQYNALRALSICYLLFFLWSPTIVFVDPGFHLSFLATFCMIAVIPKIEYLFHWIPITPYINARELLMLAVVLPLFMLPYTMYFSGVVPTSALPANILLGIVTPVVMIVTPCVLLLSFINPLANVCGGVLSFILELTIDALEIVNQLPQYNTPELSSWSVVGVYGVVVYILYKKELRSFTERLRNSLQQPPSSFDQGSQ